MTVSLGLKYRLHELSGGNSILFGDLLFILCGHRFTFFFYLFLDSCIMLLTQTKLWNCEHTHGHMQFERKECILPNAICLKPKGSCQAASVAINLNHNEWDTFPHSKNTTGERYKYKLTLIVACGWIYVPSWHLLHLPKWLRFFNDSFHPCFHGDMIWFR